MTAFSELKNGSIFKFADDDCFSQRYYPDGYIWLKVNNQTALKINVDGIVDWLVRRHFNYCDDVNLIQLNNQIFAPRKSEKYLLRISNDEYASNVESRIKVWFISAFNNTK